MCEICNHESRPSDLPYDLVVQNPQIAFISFDYKGSVTSGIDSRRDRFLIHFVHGVVEPHRYKRLRNIDILLDFPDSFMPINRTHKGVVKRIFFALLHRSSATVDPVGFKNPSSCKYASK